MDKPDLYKAPATGPPAGIMNPAAWVIYWVAFALACGGLVVLTPGQDPFSMVLMMTYSASWFALGAFFIKLSRRGKRDEA